MGRLILHESQIGDYTSIDFLTTCTLRRPNFQSGHDDEGWYAQNI